MLDDNKKRIVRIIEAGETAVEELIKVLSSKIIEGDSNKDLQADRLKNAAATKKQALNDAFDILSRIELEKQKLEDDDAETADKTPTSFIEGRAKKS